MLVLFLSGFHMLQGQSWQLVWSDEFTTSISPAWTFESGGGGWGNGELEYYRQQNATVQGGQLLITARKENYGGMKYTSARMKTQGSKSWTYGRMEARISMPAFQGIWPAFWMLGDTISKVGWPSCGEIDIMEHINTGGTVNGTIHWANANGSAAQYGGSTTTTVTGYHIYAVEWDSTAIKWYVDSVLYNTANIANNINHTNAFHHNFFIILNMAVGGSWPGTVIDTNALPATMYVDYVRVYQRSKIATGLIQSPQDANALKLFPNPTKGMLFWEEAPPHSLLKIYSLQGQLVKTLSGNLKAFDISDLADGTYILAMQTESGIRYQRIFRSE